MIEDRRVESGGRGIHLRTHIEQNFHTFGRQEGTVEIVSIAYQDQKLLRQFEGTRVQQQLRSVSKYIKRIQVISPQVVRNIRQTFVAGERPA